MKTPYHSPFFLLRIGLPATTCAPSDLEPLLTAILTSTPFFFASFQLRRPQTLVTHTMASRLRLSSLSPSLLLSLLFPALLLLHMPVMVKGDCWLIEGDKGYVWLAICSQNQPPYETIPQHINSTVSMNLFIRGPFILMLLRYTFPATSIKLYTFTYPVKRCCQLKSF